MAKMYEQLSQSEQDTLRRLQAKQKRVQRQDKAFWEWVDDHADEIRDHLGANGSSEGSNDDYWFREYQDVKAERDELQKDIDKLIAVADEYGCTLQELYGWIRQENQINYYRRQSSTAKVHPTTVDD